MPTKAGLRDSYCTRILLHQAGGVDGLRYWNRRGFRILMYHQFPSTRPGCQEALARQCAYMVRHYQLVTLTDVARSLLLGTSSISVLWFDHGSIDEPAIMLWNDDRHLSGEGCLVPLPPTAPQAEEAITARPRRLMARNRCTSRVIRCRGLLRH